jgi:hypothetical protein
MNSFHDGKVRALEVLRLHKELLRAQSAEWQNADEGLLETLQVFTISKEQYEEEQNAAQIHRFELVSKEILLARNLRKYERELESCEDADWSGVIRHLLSRAFLDERIRRVHPEDREKNRWSDPTHKARTEVVRKFYNSYSLEDYLEVWCPITQRYYSATMEMKTPYIVPPHLGYESMQHVFGEPGQGMALLWSSGNGLPMISYLEGLFNEGKLTLIGHQQSGGNPIEYSVVILDDSMLDYTSGYGDKISDINLKRLVFKNERRPTPKCMYWHYATSLLRHYKMQTDGIEGKISTLVDGRAWGNTPGSWYNASTVKYMTEFWGGLAARIF